MKKNVISYFLLISFVVILFTGCASKEEKPVVENMKSSGVNVITTLYPQYDFAKEIIGDKGIVTLLLPPGVESHSYEPTPSDIIKIESSDLFIYTGENMEIWSDRIIEGIQNPNVKVLDVSKGISLAKTEDETEHYHAENEGSTIERDHYYDPHIWTSPIIAKSMVRNILDAICEVDPNNADYYKSNAENYTAELEKLDAEIRFIVENSTKDEMIFGSKFALFYFAQEYGLKYEAAFDNCSTETEPSAKTVAHLIEEIKDNDIPVIYYAELIEPKVAQSISEETGAKMLLFHSCHNVSKEEFENGATYLSLMRQNAKNLKEGLN